MSEDPNASRTPIPVHRPAPGSLIVCNRIQFNGDGRPLYAGHYRKGKFRPRGFAFERGTFHYETSDLTVYSCRSGTVRRLTPKPPSKKARRQARRADSARRA